MLSLGGTDCKGKVLKMAMLTSGTLSSVIRQSYQALVEKNTRPENVRHVQRESALAAYSLIYALRSKNAMRKQTVGQLLAGFYWQTTKF